jgi:ABC-2 type transport system ATP-binding protein
MTVTVSSVAAQAATSSRPLVARALTKRYGRITAVDGLDVALEPGTITGFLGPNGAGKSTTLRMLVGLVRPSAGAALLFGRPATDPAARRSLGYMPADPVFVGNLTGSEYLDVLAGLHGEQGACDRDEVSERLQLSGRDLQRPVRDLSGGTLQKLGIVAALQHRPGLVLLDEPANRLDPLVHRRFCALLREIAGAGRTVLLSSHVLAEVEVVCDRALLLREGRLLASVSIEDARVRAPRHVRLFYRSRPRPPELLDRARVEGDEVVGVMPAGRPDLLRRWLDDPDLVDVEVTPPSLDELFQDFYEETPDASIPDH